MASTHPCPSARDRWKSSSRTDSQTDHCEQEGRDDKPLKEKAFIWQSHPRQFVPFHSRANLTYSCCSLAGLYAIRSGSRILIATWLAVVSDVRTRRITSFSALLNTSLGKQSLSNTLPNHFGLMMTLIRSCLSTLRPLISTPNSTSLSHNCWLVASLVFQQPTPFFFFINTLNLVAISSTPYFVKSPKP